MAILRRVGVDRAVAYGAFARLWQLLSGPLTLLVIARKMSPDMQGVYYTFGSVTALQTFLELGLYLVIINFASHEWASLHLDSSGELAGDPDALSRLISLTRLLFKWYGVLSALFVALVLPIGWLFFSHSTLLNVEWRGPWAALVMVTGVLLWTLPFISILEGCGQIQTINRFRLNQAIAGNIVFWSTLMLGGGLWALVLLTAVNAARDLYLLLVQYGRFFRPFFTSPLGQRVRWRTEIWPMQWRVALGGASNYLAFSLVTPVIFHYHGAAVAGRTGMTWTLTAATQSLAFMWVYPKVPLAAQFIAKGDIVGLNQLWRRVTLTSTLVAVSALSAVWVVIAGLNAVHQPLAARLLPPLPAGLFLLGALAAHLIQCFTAYLRAHKREAITRMNVASHLLLGALIWTFGREWGPTGAGAAYLLVVSCVMLPWTLHIVRRSRRDWH